MRPGLARKAAVLAQAAAARTSAIRPAGGAGGVRRPGDRHDGRRGARGRRRADGVVVVDGFISSAAALVAVRIAPEVLAVLRFRPQLRRARTRSACSQPWAPSPLLHLGLRLGEGDRRRSGRADPARGGPHGRRGGQPRRRAGRPAVNPCATKWRLLACAVQFLTRLPTPHLRGFEPDWTVRAARYYPLAGQLVGLICAGVLLAASRVWSWPAAGAAWPIAVGALVTGGFHEDGLADTFDGLGGGRTREARLASHEGQPDRDLRRPGAGPGRRGAHRARWRALRALARRRRPAVRTRRRAGGGGRGHGGLALRRRSCRRQTPPAQSAGLRRAEAAAACLLGLWPALLLGWRRRACRLGASDALSTAPRQPARPRG